MSKISRKSMVKFYNIRYAYQQGIWIGKRDLYQLKDLLRHEEVLNWIIESGVGRVAERGEDPIPSKVLTVKKVKALVKKTFYKHGMSFKGMRVLSFKTQVFLGSISDGYIPNDSNICGDAQIHAKVIWGTIQELKKLEGVKLDRATSVLFSILEKYPELDWYKVPDIVLDIFQLPQDQRVFFYKGLVEKGYPIDAVKTVVYLVARKELGFKEGATALRSRSFRAIAEDFSAYPEGFLDVYKDIKNFYRNAEKEGIVLERTSTRLITRLRTVSFSPSKKTNVPSPEFKLNGYKLIQLKDDSLLHFVVGTEVGSCQTLGDAANECCRHAYTDADGSTWVVLNKNNRMVAHSWVWRVGDDLVIDNIEAGIIESNQEAMDTVAELYRMAIDWITQTNPLGVRRVLVGTRFTKVKIPGTSSPIKNPHTPPVEYSDAQKTWAFGRK